MSFARRWAERPAGLSAIIVYKLFKAVAEALLGVAAVVLALRGAEASAATLAEILLEHFTGGWVLEVATILVKVATRKHVLFVAALSFGDAGLSAVEGLALRAGRSWAPWLVVVATSVLLPWELWECLRRPDWGRALLLVLNTGVVFYLLCHAARERRLASRQGPAGQPSGRRASSP